jgi:4-amino-4-deoxy-L-arabinose transferase-like glycosyltransferase
MVGPSTQPRVFAAGLAARPGERQMFDDGGTKAIAITRSGVQPRRAASGLAIPGARSCILLAAIALPAFFLLYGLGAFPLRDNNEGLYAEIAREMLAGGSYIVPHLNGVPYIEKPPLLYWLCALSMQLFGATPAAARLVSAASMLALCFGLLAFGRRHGNVRAGAFASVVLASALPVALLSHVVLFDPLLTALFGGSLLCWLHGYLVHRRSAFLLSAFLLGLAVLEKGGVALVMAAGIGALFLLLMRDLAGWRRLVRPPALAVLLATAAGWHIAASMMQPGFSWFYFVNEHLLRFLGQRLPDDYHHGAPWFYLPRLLFMLLPWSPFLLLLARQPLSRQRRSRTIVRFCQAAVLFPLLFFSVSAAKADYYLLVAMPALALWMGYAMARGGAAAGRLPALCWAASLGLALLGWWVVPAVLDSSGQAAPVALGCIAAAVCARAAHRLFARLPSRNARDLALVAVALAAMPALVPLYRVADQRAPRDSSSTVARILSGRDLARVNIFIYRDFEDQFSTLPFYLGHPVPVIDSASRDLAFGCGAAPARFCVGVDALRGARARGRVAVVLKASRATEFLARAPGQWEAEWVGQKMVLFSVRCETCGPGKSVALSTSPRPGTR